MIIKAYALPHPPLAIPSIGRGQEKGIKKTVDSLNEVATEIASLSPDTIIFVTPHNIIYSDYFHISPGREAEGGFSRFNDHTTHLEARYDTALASEIIRLATAEEISAGYSGERDKSLDHGVTVPMWFINRLYTDYEIVRISQSGMSPSEHYRLGRLIALASDNLNRRTILIGSSDMSHKLAADGPYGYAPEGPQFDTAVIKALSDGDFLSLLKIPDALRECAAECGYNSLTTLAGLFDCMKVSAKVLSYEGPFGVGYAVASFTPDGANEKCNILDQFTEFTLSDALNNRKSEDSYRALARASLEYSVKTGEKLPLPDNLPDEMLTKKAGIFVSLSMNGSLRGCIGTISPVTDCVAYEIIQNAVSAGLHDPRFERVTVQELQLLTYKVDVLSPPESISSLCELDIKRYGVIVSNGHRRGLLLPNLEGVDTVEEQVAIARRKAGIDKTAPIALERFEVTRHE